MERKDLYLAEVLPAGTVRAVPGPGLIPPCPSAGQPGPSPARWLGGDSGDHLVVLRPKSVSLSLRNASFAWPPVGCAGCLGCVDRLDALGVGGRVELEGDLPEAGTFAQERQ